MIDSFSSMVFFIYVLVLLLILLYISPVLSALVMVLLPVALVYLLPGQTIQFFSMNQFSFAGVSIQNLHILLLVWSALIGIVAYTEIISWYLLIYEKPKLIKQESTGAVLQHSKPEGTQKSVKNKLEDFLSDLGYIMSGKK